MANNLWGEQQVALQDLLKEIRKEAKLNQEGLASLLGRPQSFISKYESGERKLDYLEIREICDKCSVTVAKFDGRLSKLLPR